MEAADTVVAVDDMDMAETAIVMADTMTTAIAATTDAGITTAAGTTGRSST
jgi:hypothetical protein